MVVAAGLQRRPWGLGLALALQVATVACGLLVPALGVMGLVFGLVWGFLLYLRRRRGRQAGPRRAAQPAGAGRLSRGAPAPPENRVDRLAR